MWLLSRNREKDAMKSLCWLRGWVPAKVVQNEFDKMKRYNEFSRCCSNCRNAQIKCTHPLPTTKERFKEILRSRTLKPAAILLTCSFVSQFAGMNQFSPFIVQILATYRSSIPAEWGTVVLSIVALVGAISWGSIVRFVGKRRIFLTALAICCVCHHILGIYGFVYLPSGSKSFDKKGIQIPADETSIVPLIVFIVLKFFTTGIIGVPVMMFSELFPFKTRTLASGCTMAISFIIVFISHKSFINVEDLLSLPGAMIAYGVVGLVR